MVVITVWCESCNKSLDDGIVNKDSSLLLWNDFTTIKKHLHHRIILRLKSNCPRGSTK